MSAQDNLADRLEVHSKGSVDGDYGLTWRSDARALLREAAERIRQQEEALREIADGDTSEHEWRRVARAALERVSS